MYALFVELEAYSNMISVFRAQGPLEDHRKKLLEELRAVLHISHDRHSAEARRVSNDELLATIAERYIYFSFSILQIDFKTCFVHIVHTNF